MSLSSFVKILVPSLILTALLVIPAIAQTPGGLPGIVMGKIHIGPLCPHEPCANAGYVYSQYHVILKKYGKTVQTYTILPNGYFAGPAAAGSYTINIDPNPWNPDCAPPVQCDIHIGEANVPAGVLVKSAQMSTYNIEIDTGIRFPSFR